MAACQLIETAPNTFYDDPELAAMQSELKALAYPRTCKQQRTASCAPLEALKDEIDGTASGLTDAMWDELGDDDLSIMFTVQASSLATCCHVFLGTLEDS